MSDPSRDELESYLAAIAEPEDDELDRQAAIHWFAAHYHNGQSSELYSVLSTSRYHPGTLENGPRDTAELYYDALVAEFA